MVKDDSQPLTPSVKKESIQIDIGSGANTAINENSPKLNTPMIDMASPITTTIAPATAINVN